MVKITPVILSGGGGTRLWPMSTPERPKQFLALTGEHTMFQMTLARVKSSEDFTAPLVVGSAMHRQLIDTQLTQLGTRDATLLLEPCARNTAPAIALAALACDDPATPMLVMPSDHVITDLPAFHAAIATALPHVEGGWLATFGIEATAPETGYGYIKLGDELASGVHRARRFIEKPELARAEAMIAEGGHAWNGGIFLFRADHYLVALAIHAPGILAAARAAMDSATRDGNTIMPGEESFAPCPADSIDYAIMEKAERVAVVPVSMGWSDVGSWDALVELTPADDSSADDSISAVDASGNFVKSDGTRIHLAGVENMIVVASGKDVLIVPRGMSQNVKQIVEGLKKPD
ncbi:MAG: sugar phosphate nucleotidyltransferase [Sphingorhabdus sp.]